ncbi:MAG TPA: ABC transporter permease [Candidatus Angelobacter sp.]|nr:ABC transporter permease [Candidatus Angelobacter sp.]
METLVQDVRYALRTLRRSPGFAATAILTLALGIGANTAIFTLINAVLLKSLPVAAPQELVVIGDPEDAHSRTQGSPIVDYFSMPLYRDLEQGTRDVFSGMAASSEVHLVRVVKNGVEVTTNATVVLTSGNYFSVLGVNPAFGRTFIEDGAKGANPVAVLSYGFWQDKLGGAPDIVGQTFLLRDHPFTVIGVAAAGFQGDTVGDSQDLWVPLSMEEQLLPGRQWLDTYSASWLHLIGRLRPGVTLTRARGAVNVTFQQLVQGPVGVQWTKVDRDEMARSAIQVSAGGRGLSELRGHFFKPLMLLAAMVGLVLLMACCNVANLLLARAAGRRREFAVRAAIGAPPGRLIRQLLTESIFLALLGGVAGLLVAQWGTNALLALGRNHELQASPDLRVMAFTAGLCVFTGILFGLIPAWQSRRLTVTAGLRAGAQSNGSAPGSFWTWGKSLVAIQVAVSLLVLFSAGLLSRSLRNLKNVDLGYSQEHLLLMRTDPVGAGYNIVRGAQFADQMIARISALPGVRGVSYSKNGLFSGSESDLSIAVEGFTPRTEEDAAAATDYVGPGYFAAVGIPIILGRDISTQDTQTSLKVAVINQSMARFYFGNDNPIGRKFTINDASGPKDTFEIVGVARDVQDHDLRTAVARRFYLPYIQGAPAAGINFEIRCAGNPNAAADSARKQIREFDRSMPVYSARSLNELLDNSIKNEILIAWLSGFFGMLGLTLACVGLYGVMSYSVGRQTKEIGLRMALGAQRSSMLWLVFRQAGTVVVTGVLAGVPLALAGSYLFTSMLYGLKGTDPLSMFAAVLVLALVALLAAAIPARRAAKVDPMVALRYE